MTEHGHATCGTQVKCADSGVRQTNYKVHLCHLLALCACMLSCFSLVRLFVTLWTLPTRLLCPWDSLGKNTGVGCHALLQGIFPAQGQNLNLMSPALQAGSSSLMPPEKSY